MMPLSTPEFPRMTPTPPAVSVVMPVYNGTPFLNRAIDSLRQQTFPDWELLAVDDGSADGSGTQLDTAAAADPRVRVFRHPVNRGPSAARNTALAAARGEWIAYLDCDDSFYSDHLARVWAWRGRGDVLVFRYDLVEDRTGHPNRGQAATYDPEAHLGALITDILAVPLGVVHRRDLLDRVGRFDEARGRHRDAPEDADLWHRFARNGAVFAFVPHPSGRYYVRADSLSRTRPASPDGSAVAEHPAALTVRIVPSAAEPGAAPQTVEIGPVWAARPPAALRPRVLFASYHCYHDPASGAAVCTRDLFAALSARGWRVGAYTGPALDDPAAPPIGTRFRGRAGVASAPGTCGPVRFTVFTESEPGGFPVTVFEPDPPASARWPSADEAGAFLGTLEQIIARFRPDVVLTYGGDAASAGVAAVARRASARVAFWLHNFAYPDPAAFVGCDAVVVPSEFSRTHHRAALGIACVALPPVIDDARVRVDRPDGGKYLTFVNPIPEKGVRVFARVAEILGRDRPDIPLLVVEGRGRVDGLGQCGIDLTRVRSFSRMESTPDPRRFYRLTRVMLVPSVWRESFGRVAAEAMRNGIPVVASDRGALPEVVGAGGVCLPIPADITPESVRPPTEDEVAPWIAAVLRWWDDPGAYAGASAAARAGATRWHPDVVVPRWEAFLTELAARPSGRGTGA